MKKLAIILCLAVFVVWTSEAAVVPVSGGSGLQAAISGANPGDIVEITDSLDYPEDIFIDKDNLTLRSASGQRASITAQNATQRGDVATAMGDLLLPPGNGDQLGVYVEADGVTVENLKIQNLTGDFQSNGLNATAACFVLGDNVTIRNCELVGTDLSNNDCVLVANAGDLTAYSGSTVAAARTTNNLLVEDCVFSAGRRGILIPDFGAEFSTGNPAQVRQSASAGTVRDCTFTVTRRAVQSIGMSGWSFENCSFQHVGANGDALRLQGGSANFTDCTVYAPGRRPLNAQAIPSSGGEWMNLTFTRCTLCGGVMGDNVNLIDDANVTFDHCILSATPAGDPTFFANNGVIHCRPASRDGSFGLSPDLPPLPSEWRLRVVNCDIICDWGPSHVFQAGIMIDGLADLIPFGPGNAPYPYHVEVYNTIGVGNTPILLLYGGIFDQVYSAFGGPFGVNPSPGSTLTVENCDFIDLFDPAPPQFAGVGADSRIAVDWAGTSWTDLSSPTLNPDGNNLRDFDPLYPNPFDCSDPANFEYTHPQLFFYGNDGGPIGSQVEVIVETSAVEEWGLYE